MPYSVTVPANRTRGISAQLPFQFQLEKEAPWIVANSGSSCVGRECPLTQRAAGARLSQISPSPLCPVPHFKYCLVRPRRRARSREEP